MTACEDGSTACVLALSAVSRAPLELDVADDERP
jgi:hypothetical protein